MNDKRRENLIGARQLALERIELVIGEKHYPDHQEKKELKKNHEPAQHKRLLTVTHVATSQQPLNEQLIRSVRCHRQARPTQTTAPEIYSPVFPQQRPRSNLQESIAKACMRLTTNPLCRSQAE